MATYASSANQAAARTRWRLSISSETDASVREYFHAQGMKKEDFSRFVDNAARWSQFDATMQGI